MSQSGPKFPLKQKFFTIYKRKFAQFKGIVYEIELDAFPNCDQPIELEVSPICDQPIEKVKYVYYIKHVFHFVCEFATYALYGYSYVKTREGDKTYYHEKWDALVLFIGDRQLSIKNKPDGSQCFALPQP